MEHHLPYTLLLTLLCVCLHSHALNARFKPGDPLKAFIEPSKADFTPPHFAPSTHTHLASTYTPSKKPKIVCTGMGVVNGVGNGIRNFWENLVKGRNAFDKIKSFDPEGMICQIACEIDQEDLNSSQYWKSKRDEKNYDPFISYALAAAKMAIEDANLDLSKIDLDRFGVIVGSGIGGIKWLEKESITLQNKGPRRVSPFLVPAMISNSAAGIIAIETGARGVNHGVVSACATSGHSMGVAMRYLQNGEADVIICGGSESSITPLSMAGFNSLRAMAQGYNDNPKAASRPFDKDRRGFVMGEGSGIVILETEEHALKRNAPHIYAEVAGYAANCDSFHITRPDSEGKGLAKCFELALKDGGIEKQDVGYINAHGTSTPLNDKIETTAFKSVFGPQAYKIPISSTKSMTGHCLGAAGAIESCVAMKALETGIIPPTLNQNTPDPDCDLNYTPNEAKKLSEPIKVAISDTLGFGGHNAVLVFKNPNI